MNNAINLLLACPECGGTEWEPAKDRDDEPCFRCLKCNSLEFPENMEAVGSDDEDNVDIKNTALFKAGVRAHEKTM